MAYFHGNDGWGGNGDLSLTESFEIVSYSIRRLLTYKQVTDLDGPRRLLAASFGPSGG